MAEPREDPPLSFKEAVMEEVRLLRPEEEAPKLSSKDTPIEEKLFAMNNWALCLSGGGIRSAAFCLGVLNALVNEKLLSRFDYLSTVSGGGYIGAWLSAAIAREGSGHGVRGIEGSVDVKYPPGFDPMGHLRRNVQYLSAMPGIPGNTTWIFAGVYLQKLILAWIAAFPLIALIAILPDAFWPSTQVVLPWEQFYESVFGGVVCGGASWFLFLFRPFSKTPFYRGRLGLNVFLLLKFIWAFALTNIWISYWEGNRAGAREFYFSYHIAIICLILLLTTPLAGWAVALAKDKSRGSFRLLIPLIPAVAAEIGMLLYCARAVASSATEITRQNPWALVPIPILAHLVGIWVFRLFDAKQGPSTDWAWWDAAQLKLLSFSLIWVALYSVVRLGSTLTAGQPGRQLAILIAALLSGLLFSALIYSSALDINPFSKPRKGTAALQATLLATCGLVTICSILIFTAQLLTPVYHLAAYFYGPETVGYYPSPNQLSTALILLCLLPAVIGFLIDPNDLSIHSFYRDGLVRTFLGASRPRNPDPITGIDPEDDLPLTSLSHRPLHVINAAARHMDGSGGATFGPATISFTFTPLHCGSGRDGYRPTAEYGGGISVGTAMAISGAAIALNLRRATSPVVTFARSLLNAGLGVWLGNPAKDAVWRRRGPAHPVIPLVTEITGYSRYVHLSDGGHFENLGVYEMLRRRCSTVIVADAGWDPTGACTDLVSLIYRARNELHTSIKIDVKELQGASGQFAKHFVRGKIRYPEGTEGEFYYIKPVLTGREDMEVRTYSALNKHFPHETTLDQWFTEAQFEAYRQLGQNSGEELVAAGLKAAKDEQPRCPFGYRPPKQHPPDYWQII